MPERRITMDEFKRRLAQLCLRGGGGFPRKREDQQILLTSILLRLDPRRPYSEAELNEALKRWPSRRSLVRCSREPLLSLPSRSQCGSGSFYAGPASSSA